MLNRHKQALVLRLILAMGQVTARACAEGFCTVGPAE